MPLVLIYNSVSAATGAAGCSNAVILSSGSISSIWARKQYRESPSYFPNQLFHTSKYHCSVILSDLFDLPTGITTHILRHTFASHFMINGGNILTLQRILGHSDISVTMRYAHLSPEHLSEAAILNSAAIMEKKWKQAVEEEL